MNMNNQDKLEEKKLTELELLQFIEQEYGQKIRYNLLTEEIELDGLETDLDLMYKVLLEKHGIKASKQSVIDNFKFLASKNKYDPTTDMGFR